MESLNVIPVVLAQTSPVPVMELVASKGTELTFWGAVTNAGFFEQVVMLILGGFSAISWAIIIYKYAMMRRAFNQSESFLDTFWSSKRLDVIYQESEGLGESPVSQVFRAGYIELAKLKRKEQESEVGDTQLGSIDSIHRSMRRAALTELTHLESLVPFLGTTGSTSPFIGLLGTVVGIMSAFQQIGMDKSAGLATVAPGIGGALVATAFGLVAAIPAVIAYNDLLSRIRVLDAEMDNFSADFLNIVKRHFF
ncbi:MAG: protein TolQ [Myxococcota bacterium]|nr:protein TolQ [Myxococcota bacterium]